MFRERRLQWPADNTHIHKRTKGGMEGTQERGRTMAGICIRHGLEVIVESGLERKEGTQDTKHVNAHTHPIHKVFFPCVLSSPSPPPLSYRHSRTRLRSSNSGMNTSRQRKVGFLGGIRLAGQKVLCRQHSGMNTASYCPDTIGMQDIFTCIPEGKENVETSAGKARAKVAQVRD